MVGEAAPVALRDTLGLALLAADTEGLTEAEAEREGEREGRGEALALRAPVTDTLPVAEGRGERDTVGEPVPPPPLALPTPLPLAAPLPEGHSVALGRPLAEREARPLPVAPAASLGLPVPLPGIRLADTVPVPPLPLLTLPVREAEWQAEAEGWVEGLAAAVKESAGEALPALLAVPGGLEALGSGEPVAASRPVGEKEGVPVALPDLLAGTLGVASVLPLLLGQLLACTLAVAQPVGEGEGRPLPVPAAPEEKVATTLLEAVAGRGVALLQPLARAVALLPL